MVLVEGTQTGVRLIWLPQDPQWMTKHVRVRAVENTLGAWITACARASACVTTTIGAFTARFAAATITAPQVLAIARTSTSVNSTPRVRHAIVIAAFRHALTGGIYSKTAGLC